MVKVNKSQKIFSSDSTLDASVEIENFFCSFFEGIDKKKIFWDLLTFSTYFKAKVPDRTPKELKICSSLRVLS